jgi:hypothetical protein
MITSGMPRTPREAQAAEVRDRTAVANDAEVKCEKHLFRRRRPVEAYDATASPQRQHRRSDSIAAATASPQRQHRRSDSIAAATASQGARDRGGDLTETARWATLMSGWGVAHFAPWVEASSRQYGAWLPAVLSVATRQARPPRLCAVDLARFFCRRRSHF